MEDEVCGGCNNAIIDCACVENEGYLRDGQPEFSQEYESPEDVYAEQEVSEGEDY